MPNATSVWDFSDGEILTAAKLDDVNCGIHVFANSTARTNAYGGTGERTLVEGEFSYLADTNVTAYYDGSSWQTVGASGLTLIKTQVIGSAVSSVEVTDAFSSSYDTYKIVISGGNTSTTVNWRLQLGATTTGYYYGGRYQDYSGAGQGAVQGSNVASWVVGVGSTTGNDMSVEVRNPNRADETSFSATFGDVLTAGSWISTAGNLNNTTQYTAFTLFPSSGTATSGTIRVYGYANS